METSGKRKTKMINVLYICWKEDLFDIIWKYYFYNCQIFQTKIIMKNLVVKILLEIKKRFSYGINITSLYEPNTKWADW
jgi:hypothetical protein